MSLFDAREFVALCEAVDDIELKDDDDYQTYLKRFGNHHNRNASFGERIKLKYKYLKKNPKELLGRAATHALATLGAHKVANKLWGERRTAYDGSSLTPGAHFGYGFSLGAANRGVSELWDRKNKIKSKF